MPATSAPFYKLSAWDLCRICGYPYEEYGVLT